MRVVLQQVKSASVRIDGELVGAIEKGYLLLVGMTPGDDEAIAQKMADKIAKLRTFPDENGKTNLSVSSVGGNVLCVSQFTLYGSAKEGNRPSFVNAMRPDEARVLYARFCDMLRVHFPNLQTGVFQADMAVELINDGPFTLLMDSKELFGR